MLEEVGKYSIKKLIAEGASSHVFLANAPHIQKPVALKLFKNTAQSNTNKNHLSLEANTMHLLSGQPNIVPLMDIDVDAQGRHFIVMPYYPHSLSHLLRGQHKLLPDLFIDLVEQMLTALMIIHQNNIVHRDIKATNLLLDDNNRLFLADFGIATNLTATRVNSTDKSRSKGNNKGSNKGENNDSATYQSDINATSIVIQQLFDNSDLSSKPKLKAAMMQFIESCRDVSDQIMFENGFAALKGFQTLVEQNFVESTEGSAQPTNSSDDGYYAQEFTQQIDHQATLKSGTKAILMMIRGVLIHAGDISASDRANLAGSDAFQELCNNGQSEQEAEAMLDTLIISVKAQLDEQYPDWQSSQPGNGKQGDSTLGNFDTNNTAIPSHFFSNTWSRVKVVNKRLLWVVILSGAAIASVLVLNSLILQSTFPAAFGSGDSAVSLHLFDDSFGDTVTANHQNNTPQSTSKLSQQSTENAVELSKSTKQNEEVSRDSLDDSMSVVMFDINPTNANIMLLDDAGNQAFINDNNQATVPNGVYQLRVSLNGYVTINKNIVISGNEQVESLQLSLSDSRYFIGNTIKTVADGIPVEFVLLPKMPESNTGQIRMMSFEVTNELYQACVEQGNCRTNQKLSTDPKQSVLEAKQHPAVNISWYDVTEHFIPWLALQTGTVLRLPTEKEWLYAASSNSANRFSWGDSMRSNKAHCRDCNPNSVRTTMPVMQFAPNDWLLFDMHGNAQEWTADCWQATVHVQPRCDQAAVRGGSWLDGKSQLQLNARTFLNKRARSHTTGFRLVEEVD